MGLSAQTRKGIAVVQLHSSPCPAHLDVDVDLDGDLNVDLDLLGPSTCFGQVHVAVHVKVKVNVKVQVNVKVYDGHQLEWTCT
jgi:hypothetical protein